MEIQVEGTEKAVGKDNAGREGEERRVQTQGEIKVDTLTKQEKDNKDPNKMVHDEFISGMKTEHFLRHL